MVGLSLQDDEGVHIPCQLFTPLHLPVVAVHVDRRRAIFQLGQPWNKVPEPVFDILALLGWVRQGGRGCLMETHLVVFDEHCDSSQA